MKSGIAGALGLASVLAAILLVPAVVHAQASPSQRELEGLRRRMQVPAPSVPATGAAVETPKLEPGAWSELKPDMTEVEVEQLLGKPDRVDSQASTFQWYWDKSSPKGWVRFDSARRKVLEWRYN